MDQIAASARLVASDMFLIALAGTLKVHIWLDGKR